MTDSSYRSTGALQRSEGTGGRKWPGRSSWPNPASREVLERPCTPLTKVTHCGKTQNLPLGKSGCAIFWHTHFWDLDPPPSPSLLILPCLRPLLPGDGVCVWLSHAQRSRHAHKHTTVQSSCCMGMMPMVLIQVTQWHVQAGARLKTRRAWRARTLDWSPAMRNGVPVPPRGSSHQMTVSPSPRVLCTSTQI